MKLILIILLFSYQLTKSQNNQISYVSSNKDTLVLPNNDIGNIIRNIWTTNPINNVPIIIMISESKIAKMNQIYNKRKDE